MGDTWLQVPLCMLYNDVSLLCGVFIGYDVLVNEVAEMLSGLVCF
jgi:hypothetical protein